MCYDVRLPHLNKDYLLTYLPTYLLTYLPGVCLIVASCEACSAAATTCLLPPHTSGDLNSHQSFQVIGRRPPRRVYPLSLLSDCSILSGVHLPLRPTAYRVNNADVVRFKCCGAVKARRCRTPGSGLEEQRRLGRRHHRDALQTETH